MNCQREGDNNTCDVRSAAIDLTVEISKAPKSSAQFEMLTTGTGRQRETALQIASHKLTLPPTTKQRNAQNLAVLAEMCAHGHADIQNVDLRKSTSLAGFCYRLAICVGRALGCY